MPLTPVEVRHVDLKRAWLRGYRRKPVDQLLDQIANSFEEVWRERADLSDRLEELETDAAKAPRARGVAPLDARFGRASRPGHEGAGPA